MKLDNDLNKKTLHDEFDNINFEFTSVVDGLSRSRIKSFMKMMPGNSFFCSFSESGNVLFYSPSVSKMINGEEELLFKTIFKNIRSNENSKDKTKTINNINKFEFEVIPENDKRTFELSYSPYIDSSGNKYFDCYGRDISKLRDAETELMDSRERYRSVVMQSAENIYIMDMDTKKVVKSNPTLQKLIGYTEEELLNMTVFDFIAHDDVNEKIEHVVREGKINLAERQYRTKDNRIIDVEVSSAHINYGGKKALLVVSRDITIRKSHEKQILEMNTILDERVKERTAELEKEIHIRKKAEQELLDTQKGLAKALQKEKMLNDMKSKFITMISHEYRTPLTVIMTSSYLVERYLLPDSGDKPMSHLDKIRKSVNMMVQMLENVLNIGRSESGEIDFMPEKIDISQLIDDIITETRAVISKTIDYNLSIKLKSNTIITDKNLLRQILSNIILNAAKFSPNDSRVIIDISETKDMVKTIVKNKGLPISEEDQEKIFEPFYRGHNVGNISGTGLGLALVKVCVDILKGTINFSSTKDKGTIFEISIPKE